MWRWGKDEWTAEFQESLPCTLKPKDPGDPFVERLQVRHSRESTGKAMETSVAHGASQPRVRKAPCAVVAGAG